MIKRGAPQNNRKMIFLNARANKFRSKMIQASLISQTRLGRIFEIEIKRNRELSTRNYSQENPVYERSD